MGASQSIGQYNLEHGKEYNENQEYALPIAVTTGLIGQLNPMEANIATKGLVRGILTREAVSSGKPTSLLKSAGGVAKRFAGSMIKEGPIEEGAQGVFETGFTNLGQGKDFGEGQGKAFVENSIVGAAMGGAMHPFTKNSATVEDAVNNTGNSESVKPPATGEEVSKPTSTEGAEDAEIVKSTPTDQDGQSPAGGNPTVSAEPNTSQQAIPTQPEIVTESDKPNTPLTPEEAARTQPGERGTAIPVPTQQTQENTNTEAIPTGEKQELDFSGMTGTKEEQKTAREKAATDALGKDFALRHSWIYEKTAGWNSSKIQAGITIARADEDVLSDGPGMDNKMPNEKEISTLGRYIEAYGPQGAAAELRKEGEKIIREGTTNDQINKGERLIAQAELLEGKSPEEIRNNYLQNQEKRKLEAQAKIDAEAKAKEALKAEAENKKNTKNKKAEAAKIAEEERSCKAGRGTAEEGRSEKQESRRTGKLRDIPE